MNDHISTERLAKLHPKAQGAFQSFIEECEQSLGITLRISQGLRTIGEQNALYAQGRTAPGNIVTNAKGGSSFHNYGLAVDLVEMVDDDTEVNWKYDMGTLEPIAAKYGFSWGGNWVHIKDYPHFEITYGYTWEQLLDKFNSGQVDDQGYVLLDDRAA